MVVECASVRFEVVQAVDREDRREEGRRGGGRAKEGKRGSVDADTRTHTRTHTHTHTHTHTQRERERHCCVVLSLYE